MPVDNPVAADLKKTPLHDLHVALGARMVPFAGYAMPVQYPSGIVAEHLHTRAAAGLFDVSHMGQVRVSGAAPQTAIERLVPGDIAGLGVNRMRYTQFTNDDGGILDDLMVTRRDGDLFVVVNAGCKDADLAHMQAGLPDCRVEMLGDRALLALQGPQAVAVLAALAPAVAAMPFMSYAEVTLAGAPCLVTRSGYTGEDGFEISVPADAAAGLAQRLLDDARVKPIGLGARDSLRLEAGLCLYGHDIDTGITPVEAGLAWSIGKRRRAEGGFPGAAIIQRQLSDGPARRRVGIRPDGRAPAREHTPITDAAGATIGEVTSGGFGPSVNGPVAMGYVPAALAKADTPVNLVVRGKPLPARIVTLPFVTKRYAS
jgi:aminomethyltransferase